ncbi:hypothetical protein NDI45_19440 [Leptolyngbya sp. GB1-A1]|uniref:hypothetical protein n=1 Tax=Leptolyngbya sp. GB1-A1 TaxID=2933908 RepID=UPI003298FB1C
MSSSPDPDYPPQCQLCQFYTHNPHLRCTLHPLGLESDNCPDFRAIAQLPELEEQWQPEGAAYYNGELILQPKQRTPAEQMELLDTHPLFTGRCPACEIPIAPVQPAQVHWDCRNCGWIDDSV